MTIAPSAIRRADIENELPQDIAARIAALRTDPDPIAVPKSPAAKLDPILRERDVEEFRSREVDTGRRRSISATERRRRCILSALIREIDKQQGNVNTLDRQTFKVKIAGEDLELTLKERRRQVRSPLTQEERRWSFYGSQDWKLELEKTGELILRLENYLDRPVQKQWSDLEGRPLESRLREVLIGILIAAGEIRRLRLEHDLSERRRLRELEQRLAAEETRRAQQTRLEELRAQAAAWAEARRIREYIDAAVNFGRRQAGSTADLDGWAQWATGVADLIDPLRAAARGELSNL